MRGSVVVLWVIAACVPGEGAPSAATSPTGPIDAPDSGLVDEPVPPPDLPSCEPPPTCEVGTGRSRFEPLSTGGPVRFVHGPQGGWHVDAAVRARHTTPIVRVLPQVRHVPSGLLLAGADGPLDTYNQALVSDTPCFGEAWGMLAFIDEPEVTNLALICGLAGDPVELRIELTDLSGRTAICAEVGVVELDPIDIEPCAALP